MPFATRSYLTRCKRQDSWNEAYFIYHLINNHLCLFSRNLTLFGEGRVIYKYIGNVRYVNNSGATYNSKPIYQVPLCWISFGVGQDEITWDDIDLG